MNRLNNVDIEIIQKTKEQLKADPSFSRIMQVIEDGLILFKSDN